MLENVCVSKRKLNRGQKVNISFLLFFPPFLHNSGPKEIIVITITIIIIIIIKTNVLMIIITITIIINVNL